MFRQLTDKKVLASVMTFFLIGTGFLMNPIPAHAATQPDTDDEWDNIQTGPDLIRQFRFEKKLDMTNAPDRTRVPKLSVPFVLSEIPQGKEEEYGIGKSIGAGQGYSIQKGEFNSGSEAEWEVVNFNPDDAYDEKLTDLLDHHPDDGGTILDHSIKHDWGGMKSSDGIQTAQAGYDSNKPGDDAYFADDERNGWPKDTIAWRCFNEGGEVGSFDDGCQILLNFSFDNFSYSQTFNLRSNPAATYYATSVQKNLFTHKDVNADGTINSVSKSLWRPQPIRGGYVYEDSVDGDFDENAVDTEALRKAFKRDFLQDDIPTFAELTPKLKASYTAPDGSEVDYGIRRYILREGKPTGEDADLLASNNETKIVDIVGFNDNFMIFNSVEEADAYYANRDPQNLSLYNVPISDIKPVTFVNRYKPEISVSKVDENGDPLEGADFVITPKGSQEVVASWTSDTNVKSLRLDEGDYVLQETKTPENYQKLDEFSFHVDEDGLITAAGSHENVTVARSQITVKNVKTKTTPKDEADNPADGPSGDEPDDPSNPSGGESGKPGNLPGDEPGKPSNPSAGQPKKPSSQTLPKTGADGVDLALYAGLMALSGALFLGIGALRGRKEEQGR
ncbi:prealbumin-like fold domain-containing protein [Schaalia sp. ZJ1691]|uniref:prealbumin-like fold domain-containing protein n=1 Tax=Schaalia sp. ZJ1691 TaxID=2709404 RepID=UPI0013EB3D1A|nr:prealbumin-like fold domain-containing protein [Schaalia sp. ZJ1691]